MTSSQRGTRGLLLFAMLVGPTWDAVGEAPPVADVQLLRFDRYHAVELSIDGEGPFTFLVNTGVSGSAVGEKVARRLDLPVVGDGRLGAPGDPRGIDGPRVRARTVRLGGLELRNVDLVRIDFTQYLGDDRLHGILGFDYLADYLWTLDYAEGTLRVRRGVLPAADGEEVLDYVPDANGAPNVAIRIGDREMQARLDSLQFGLGLPASLQSALPLTSDAGRIGRVGDARGLFDLIGAQLADDVEIGRHIIPRPRAAFSEAYDSVGVGSEILQPFALTFDPSNRRVRLERKESRRAQNLNRNAGAVPRLDGAGTLREGFNAQQDKVRLVLILSPT